MTTLDDKLLGEKTHYYCSSGSEEEPDEEESEKFTDRNSAPKFIPSTELNEWEGSSTNTGPKGVIKDWQRYKQLEAERREEQELERLALMKKLSLTCQSSKDEEKLKHEEEELDKELQEILEDDKILEEFTKLRMQQMIDTHCTNSSFGTLLEINNGQEYLDAVDNIDKTTSVVMYIYSNSEKCCKIMYNCIAQLAIEYPEVKFCSVEVSIAGLSRHFERRGVPALLVYKNGSLVGNFIRVTDELGEEFVSSDVENYLLEHGMLPDHSLNLTSLRQTVECDNDSD